MTKAFLRYQVFLALVVPPWFASVLAAQAISGGLQGRVLDSAGLSATAVHVALSGANLQGTREATTDREGRFRFMAVPPGEYTVRIARIGTQPLVIAPVAVEIGHVTALQPVSLQSLAVRLEEVRVTAGTLSIDPVHTDGGATLTAADYAVLPGERDYKSIIAILPHINQSARGDPVNSAGATGLENMYFVDGVNVTESRAGQGGTSLPYNFIRAIEVKTGGYEAQYGRALGAVVNAVTYSGTNDFETSFFGFGTHSALSATPRAQSALRQTSSLSYDVGMRVGGAVVRDRLWYSAAYNPRVERSQREIANLGTFTDELTAQLFAGKLTWQARPRTNLELSVFGDPTKHDVVEFPEFGNVPPAFVPLTPDAYLARRARGGVTGALHASSMLTDRVLLEASLSRASGQDDMLSPSSDEPLVIDHVARTTSGGQPNRSVQDVVRFGATLKGTVSLGNHTMIAGVEREDFGVDGDLHYSTVNRDSDSSYHLRREDQDKQKSHNRVPTAYLQDSWRVLERLTLNAGVRWSTQSLTKGSGGVAQRFPSEWQPRLGFVWQPGRSIDHRVFGSWGRFYQQEPVNMAAFWYVAWTQTDALYSVDPRTAGATANSTSVYQYSENDFVGIPNLHVENSDEWTLGYERLVTRSTKLGARVIRRALRSSFQWGFDSTRTPVIGTPGEGQLAFLPRPTREYSALELTALGSWRRATYRASYVLSRNRGNYPGLFDADYGIPTPGGVRTLMVAHQAVNSTGLLPNDRTHVLKLAVSRPWPIGLTTGATLDLASGTPVNAFAPGPGNVAFAFAFTVPRGSAGRTPATADLNLRIAQNVGRNRETSRRLFFDVLHVGNPQRPVWLQELAYQSNVNGVFSSAEPSYRSARAYQQPMMARLGFEASY